MLYFISPSSRAYHQYLYLSSLDKEEVRWVRSEDELYGITLTDKNVVYGYQWYIVVSQDFINSRIIKK